MPGPRTDSNSSVGLVADGIYLLAKNVSGWARPVLGVQRVAPVRLRLHSQSSSGLDMQSNVRPSST